MKKEVIVSPNEMLEVLEIFKYDLSDSEYFRAKNKITSEFVTLSSQFTHAVRSENQSSIRQFLKSL